MKHLQWYYLDALSQQRGPISDQDLDILLSTRDALIWREGMAGWTMGSEYFASGTAPQLKQRGTYLNADGQPNAQWINAAQNSAKSFDELLGLIRGVLLDGEVNDREAAALHAWCEASPQIVGEWPGREIAARLEAVFADGVVTEEERADLTALLSQATGGTPDIPNKSTRLPLCDPAPPVIFEERTFVFTGQFVTAKRAVCEAEVIRRGGRCAGGVSGRVNYLVIGDLSSRDWLHSNYGTKILAAVSLRDEKRKPISIVSEEAWASALQQYPRVV